MSHGHVPMENNKGIMKVDNGVGVYTHVPISAPANSRKSKSESSETVEEEPRREITPITDKATVRNKPIGRRLIDSFRGEDLRSVGGHLFVDILIPSLKDLVLELIQQGAARAIKGDGYYSSTTQYNVPFRVGGPQYTAYNRYGPNSTSNSKPKQIQKAPAQSVGAKDFQDIILPDRGVAEYVLSRLREYIEMYDFVTVRELFELVDIQAPFTADNYGWNDLTRAGVRRIGGGGYVLVLPQTIALK